MNRPYGASFDVDSRHAFADGAEHLIGHGANFAGDFERGDGFAARGADKDDLIAHGDAGDIGDVEQGQVHADVPDNRGGAAADERPPSVRKRAAEAVGVADRHRSDARAPARVKRRPVAERGVTRNILQINDPRLEAEDWLERRRLSSRAAVAGPACPSADGLYD